MGTFGITGAGSVVIFISVSFWVKDFCLFIISCPFWDHRPLGESGKTMASLPRKKNEHTHKTLHRISGVSRARCLNIKISHRCKTLRIIGSLQQ